jgi:ketosteroid isomerase-like protein
MKILKIPSLIFILYIALINVACQLTDTALLQLSDNDITAIKAATREYRDAELANEWATVTQLYTENAVRLIPDIQTIRGRDAILQEFLARPYIITEYDQQIEEIEGYNDLAVVRGVFSWAIERNGEFFKGTGKYIAIYRKQTDGSWLIDKDIFNQD